MKEYEVYGGLKVPVNSKIILRLDGRSFHSLAKNLNLEKPYDEDFARLMVKVSKDLFNEFAPVFIYTFSDEINILLEDTYPIKNEQIPISKRNLLTIKISRNDGTTRGRHFSQNFIETTINTVRTLDTIKEVNLYATTNPLNTMHIAKRVFSVADRGNIKHLYVFQQNNAGIRAFQNKGHKIY